MGELYPNCPQGVPACSRNNTCCQKHSRYTARQSCAPKYGWSRTHQSSRVRNCCSFFEKVFTDGIRNFTREGSARFKPNNFTLLFDSSWKIRELLSSSCFHRTLALVLTSKWSSGVNTVRKLIWDNLCAFIAPAWLPEKITVISKKQLFSQLKMNPWSMTRQQSG